MRNKEDLRAHVAALVNDLGQALREVTDTDREPSDSPVIVADRISDQTLDKLADDFVQVIKDVERTSVDPSDSPIIVSSASAHINGGKDEFTEVVPGSQYTIEKNNPSLSILLADGTSVPVQNVAWTIELSDSAHPDVVNVTISGNANSAVITVSGQNLQYEGDHKKLKQPGKYDHTHVKKNGGDSSGGAGCRIQFM